MKYKIGDRVYFQGGKYSIQGFFHGNLIKLDTNLFVYAWEFKPIITCK